MDFRDLFHFRGSLSPTHSERSANYLHFLNLHLGPNQHCKFDWRSLLRSGDIGPYIWPVREKAKFTACKEIPEFMGYVVGGGPQKSSKAQKSKFRELYT